MLANWFDAHDSADLLRRLDGLTLARGLVGAPFLLPTSYVT